MKRILLTGSSGFVGTNLINTIPKKYSIIAINRKKNIKNTKLASYTYDQLFLNRYHANYYVHLAGKAHDLRNVTSEKEYFDVNCELTKKVYDCFLQDETSKCFIYVSSIKAVTDHSNNVIDENHPTNPKTAYGRSKLKAEEYLMSNMLGSKKTIILRPCMIHGPGNKGNLNLLYKIISKGVPWPLGSYSNKRSLLSIDNFCFVINEIITGDLNSGIYHIADSEPLSTNQIVKLIATVTDKRLRVYNFPRSLISVLAKVGNYTFLPLNEERLEKLTENYVLSNTKIVNALGKQLPVSSVLGLKKTIQSFEYA